jgi:hypothetical protein
MEMKELQNKVAALVETQCMDGNWNYCEYMHGMANGMILIQSVIKNTAGEVEFMKAPAKYLCKNRCRWLPKQLQ